LTDGSRAVDVLSALILIVLLGLVALAAAFESRSCFTADANLEHHL
jgi:hypothetical protein